MTSKTQQFSSIQAPLIAKRTQIQVKIRREARQSEIRFKRKNNLKILTEFAKPELISERYVTIVRSLYLLPNNQPLIQELMLNLDDLLKSIKESTIDNWKYFAFISNYLFDDPQEKQEILAVCFQNLLAKGLFLLNQNVNNYIQIISTKFDIINRGIESMLGYLSDKCIKMVSIIMLNFFRDYDREWQSHEILCQGLQVMKQIMNIDTDIKQGDITNEIVLMKKHKFRFIMNFFYQSKYEGLEKMIEILDDKYYSPPNDQVKEIIIKILIHLTFWVESKELIKPLVDINLYECVRSLMDFQNSLSMNKALVKLLHNLVLLDKQICKRAFEDQIVEQLIQEIYSHQKSIDKDTHVLCLSNYILSLDLQQYDIRDKIDVCYNMIDILESGISEQAKITFSGAIKQLVQVYHLVLTDQDIKLLERVIENSNLRKLEQMAERIIQISNYNMETKIL